MTTPTILYGIPNCDTVKKARAWLAEREPGFRFHDFRKDGLDVARVAGWLAAVGHEKLINRRGTTWRGLDDAAQSAAGTDEGAKALAVAHPAVVKRPVVEWPDGTVTVGFDAADWAARLG